MGHPEGLQGLVTTEAVWSLHASFYTNVSADIDAPLPRCGAFPAHRMDEHCGTMRHWPQIDNTP